MQEVDIAVDNSRAREIRESLNRIRAYIGLPDAEFLTVERNLCSVVHLLLVCIEAVVSVCTPLLAKAARRSPVSYAECFEEQYQMGLQDESLAGRWVQMVRYRNALVHRFGA